MKMEKTQLEADGNAWKKATSAIADMSEPCRKSFEMYMNGINAPTLVGVERTLKGGK